MTYHLADSVASDVLIRRLEEQSPDKDREYRKRIEAFLDAGHGSCILQRPDIAEIIIKAWSYYDGERYDLQAWVVMPNHVHVLFTMRDHSMGSVLHSWKSYTANAIGKVTGQPGLQIWHNDYWD